MASLLCISQIPKFPKSPKFPLLSPQQTQPSSSTTSSLLGPSSFCSRTSMKSRRPHGGTSSAQSVGTSFWKTQPFRGERSCELPSPLLSHISPLSVRAASAHPGVGDEVGRTRCPTGLLASVSQNRSVRRWLSARLRRFLPVLRLILLFLNSTGPVFAGSVISFQIARPPCGWVLSLKP